MFSLGSLHVLQFRHTIPKLACEVSWRNVSVSVNGLLSQGDPAMSWRLIQGVTPPSPPDSWERLQLTSVTLS